MRTPEQPVWSRVDAAIVAGACALALGHAIWFDHTADDAYISFRYVDNWVRGHGLVFNPGERVMGYSNFLWVVLLYPFALLGIPTHVAARGLGVFFAWATLVRVYSFTRATFPSRAPAIAAVSWLVATGSFALWILGGLEAHLLGFLLTLGVTGALDVSTKTEPSRFLWLGVVFGLASITRPEAIMYVAPTALWLWWQSPIPKRWGSVVLFVVVASCFLAAISLGAWIYYGDPLPNTYYAKAQPLSEPLVARGLRMTRKLVVDYRFAPVWILVIWLFGTRGSRDARGWLPLGALTTFVLFFLAIGGDMLQYHRMWVPVLPMLAILLAEGVARLPSAPALVIAAAIVALTLPNSLGGRSLESLRKGDAFLDGAHLVAERLDELPPDTWVAANNIGVLGYESRVRILDMMGLTDRHIARAPGKKVGIPGHEAHDAAYVLDRRPDLIFTGMPSAVRKPNPVWDTRGGYPSDRDLRAEPRFWKEYELRYLRLSDGRWSPVYVHHGFELEGALDPSSDDAR